jgi:hypothetical protein
MNQRDLPNCSANCVRQQNQRVIDFIGTESPRLGSSILSLGTMKLRAYGLVPVSLFSFHVISL